MGLLLTGCGVGGSSGTPNPTPTPAGPAITSITVTPGSATIGTQVQFAASVAGTGSFSTGVTWSLSGPTGSSLSAGTLSSTGLYITPYPAPATVTVTATSIEDTTKSGSATVVLVGPTAGAGPTLKVDAGAQVHAISPDIYGMNFDTGASTIAAAKAISLPVDRWGGDATSLYNYKLDVANAGSDWYFQNGVSGSGLQDTSALNTQVEGDESVGAKSLVTVPVEGWVASNGTACSFPASTFPNQVQFDPYNAGCGDGETPNAADPSNPTNITGNDPTIVAMPIDTAWTAGWVNYLVGKFGNAASGGVSIYELDNEPDWWDGVHRDVHPKPFTYDEVTNSGLATALAVKTADPTAEVSGPVMVFWWDLFYSKKDVEAGWTAGGGPCYQPWSNPLDREAHGGTPMIEYYLQQFAAYEATNHLRLLDYLDLHDYLAGTYNGNTVALTTAGDTAEQEVRLDSTRALWDPTYTDPNYAQPNYVTDANYTPGCTLPLQAQQFIPMAQAWVAKDYPGRADAYQIPSKFSK